ncbi:MAG: glycosyltransferase family 4 protein [Pontixanthobacter sp.]
MKLLFALPGFHRYERGAEVALLNVARNLATDANVTVVGSGDHRADTPYRYIKAGAVPRERFEKFPSFPPLRTETAWEDATFAANVLRRIHPGDYDAVVTCSFPFTHWALRRPLGGGRTKPVQVFVTQNGDWPAFSSVSEYRSFACDLLVCTNPDYEARNSERYRTALIPNGVDLDRFGADGVPAGGDRTDRDRARFGLPADARIVLMVSAFIDSKRVDDGIAAVAAMPDAHLVVAGDGPRRDELTQTAERKMPGRFHRLSLTADRMPPLYRAADAFLHMSLLESFGNVFIEAWASGLPIVAHDTPRLRWILGENTRFLCDTQNAAELSRQLTAALAQGRGSPADGIARYDWSNIAADYKAAIVAAIAGRDGAARA